MKSSDLLAAEVSLLLLRHGKDSVLKALAERLCEPPETLEDRVAELQRTNVGNKQKANRPVAKTLDIAELASAHPDKADDLRLLHTRFQNRAFLPELRNAKQFLERHGQPSYSAKSRAQLEIPVFNLIASLKQEEVSRLVHEHPADPGESSLGLIANQILGRPKR